MRKKHIDELIKSIERVRQIVKDEMPVIRRDVDFIIRNRVDSEDLIEKVLDIILDSLYIGYGEEEFKKLNDYYSTINRRNSEMYAKFYDEIVKS